MNYRNRQNRHRSSDTRQAPALLGRTYVRQSGHHVLADARPAAVELPPNPACMVEQGGRPCHHALSNQAENLHLLEHERLVKGRFEAIVPVLKRIAALQHEDDFIEQAQIIANTELGFTLSPEQLERAWIQSLDMVQLYGECVHKTLYQLVAQVQATGSLDGAATDEASSLFLDSGFHAVDISPCSDGRLKGLTRYIFRLPADAVRSRKAYAGAMFDVEANVKRWVDTELMRFREGKPVTADAGTRYLKIAVYHYSTSDPKHEGCAAHGSNQIAAAEGALQRLEEFREAIENSFCCGASVDILLIGVDTDTDAIRVHVPDAEGEVNIYRAVDNLELYRQTINANVNDARLAVYNAICQASKVRGWGAGNGEPHDGMRRMIATLLINNLSQIEYVCGTWGGRYPDIGHAERFISVGDGFEEFQLRNLAYFAHLYTVEEGAPDLDVGIKIFKKLNVAHGLPIPIAIHYRYDSRVPGSRERTVERCHRIHAAIQNRYAKLEQDGLLACGLSVQNKLPGSAIEPLEQRAAA